MEDIPKENLDKILQLFFAEVRKRNEEYEPDSLRTMLTTLDRYLREGLQIQCQTENLIPVIKY